MFFGTKVNLIGLFGANLKFPNIFISTEKKKEKIKIYIPNWFSIKSILVIIVTQKQIAVDI